MRLRAIGVFLVVLRVGGAYAQLPSPVPAPTNVHPPPEVQHRLPPDMPPVVSPRQARRPVDTTRLEAEANELARLAHDVPPKVNQIGKGQLPRDLDARLKRIEKLSRQLRRDLSR